MHSASRRRRPCAITIFPDAGRACLFVAIADSLDNGFLERRTVVCAISFPTRLTFNMVAPSLHQEGSHEFPADSNQARLFEFRGVEFRGCLRGFRNLRPRFWWRCRQADPTKAGDVPDKK